MKTLLTIFLTLFITTAVYSQTVNIDSNSVNVDINTENVTDIQIPDSVTTVFNKVYEDMKQGIKGLAESLKVGTEYVWNILVKQQLVKSLCYLAISLFLSLITIIFYRRIRFNNKAFKESGVKSRDENSYGVASAIYSVLFVLVIAANIYNINSNVGTILTGFINPEYGAIQDILTFTKQ